MGYKTLVASWPVEADLADSLCAFQPFSIVNSGPSCILVTPSCYISFSLPTFLLQLGLYYTKQRLLNGLRSPSLQRGHPSKPFHLYVSNYIHVL